MSILLYILLLLLLLWLLGWWLGRGEDLSAFDGPVENEARERLGDPAGPSAEHRQAEDTIRAQGAAMGGRSRKDMIRLSREFMETFSSGREFGCEFRPVDAGGVPAEWVLTQGADPSRRLLYIHGGGFFAGSPRSHRTITSALSEATGTAVLAIDYRLMPEHPRRAGIEDCRSAYRWILENGPTGPAATQRLFVGGDSAGGNLCLMLSNWVRDQGLRRPDGVFALSPLTDSVYASPSLRGNVDSDVMLGPLFGTMLRIPRPLLGWIFVLENRCRPADPNVSPLRADLSGLPPTLILASDSEMLFDDARRYVNKARASGSQVRLLSAAGLLHVWLIFHPEVPEAREAFRGIASFIAGTESGSV